MFGSNFVEIGIALSLLFLLLSLMCSLISETFSKYLSWRAEMLEDSIRQLLRDPDIAKQVYRHPVIRTLGQESRPLDKMRRLDALSGDRWPRSWVKWLNRKMDLATKPSYIKSTIFARVVLEVIQIIPRLDLLQELRQAINSSKSFNRTESGEIKARLLVDILAAEFDTYEAFNRKISEIGKLVCVHASEEDERASFQALIDQLKAVTAPALEAKADVPTTELATTTEQPLAAEPEPSDEQAPGARPEDPKPRSIADVRVAVARLKNAESRRILESLVSGEDVKDLTQAQGMIARYYDDVQERVTGWYKRKSQRWVFSVGIVLALFLNIDTFTIADKLLRDNSVRAIVVASAQVNIDKFKPLLPSEPGASPTVSAAGSAVAPGPAATPSGAADSSSGSVSALPGIGAEAASLKELKSELDKLKLPLGWPERLPIQASSSLPSTMAGLHQIRIALAETASALADLAKKDEAAATERLAQAKAQLESAKAALEKLIGETRAAKLDAGEAEKAREGRKAAEEAFEAAKKEIKAANESAAANLASAEKTAERVTQMKEQIQATKLSAAKAKEDADARMALSEKARVEFETDPRSCPEYLCGDAQWGDASSYYMKASVLWFLTRGLGWVVTAMAAALGAQFWFDVLGKVIQFRASKKPDENAPISPAASSR